MKRSKNKYRKPFPKETIVKEVTYNSPGHVGPFRGAIDFLVDLNTPVLAPLEGIVTACEDSHNRHGPTRDFDKYCNYITIDHPNGERSQVLHLAKGSAKVKVGDRVSTGQEIALSGNTGWTTAPHIHFFVFKDFPDGSFKGLEIQFEE